MRSLWRYYGEFRHLYPSSLLRVLVRDGEYPLMSLDNFNYD